MLDMFKQKGKVDQAKILLVDDEPDLIDTIQCRLEANNFSFREEYRAFLSPKTRRDAVFEVRLRPPRSRSFSPADLSEKDERNQWHCFTLRHTPKDNSANAHAVSKIPGVIPDRSPIENRGPSSDKDEAPRPSPKDSACFQRW